MNSFSRHLIFWTICRFLTNVFVFHFGLRILARFNIVELRITPKYCKSCSNLFAIVLDYFVFLGFFDRIRLRLFGALRNSGTKVPLLNTLRYFKCFIIFKFLRFFHKPSTFFSFRDQSDNFSKWYYWVSFWAACFNTMWCS